eukprot:Gb_37144 [translate_table: standard]
MGKPVLKRMFSPEKGSYMLVERSPQMELQLQPLVKPKKKAGSRLWMRFDAAGNSEVIECDKYMIMKRVSIPARDLRILGPVFSHSSNILVGEEKLLHRSFTEIVGGNWQKTAPKFFMVAAELL